jgi:spore maturation protein SpmA
LALNYLFIGFFLIAFVVAIIRFVFFGDVEVFTRMFTSSMDMAETGFKISLYLTGVITLWMGLMEVGERGGMVRLLGKLVEPFFRRLFPEIPKGHPANGSILMNFSANMLGLDNAATPLGLKAMQELQELNPHKERASNAMIMFMVLNTSGLTLIPINVMIYRSQMGAANPADVFIPILLATFFSTITGIVVTSLYQRINLFKPVILAYLGGVSLLIAAIIWYFSSMPQEEVGRVSTTMSSFLLVCIIVFFVALAAFKKVNVYESFIDGAKGGFQVAVKIIPYLVAILVAIGMFRESGSMDLTMDIIRPAVAFFGFNTDFVEALPTALMKPLSGSGARGMLVEAMETHGADSFVGRLAATFQGSTETTFYTLAVYFGSIGIKNTRYAVTCGLLADLAGIIAAIFIAYMFFK